MGSFRLPQLSLFPVSGLSEFPYWHLPWALASLSIAKYWIPEQGSLQDLLESFRASFRSLLPLASFQLNFSPFRGCVWWLSWWGFSWMFRPFAAVWSSVNIRFLTFYCRFNGSFFSVKITVSVFTLKVFSFIFGTWIIVY